MESSAKTLHRLALKDARAGDAPAATQRFRKLLQLTPNDPAAWFNFALLRSGQGELDDAERAYRTALKIEPGLVAAVSNLGQLLFARGRLDACLAVYDAGLRASPEEPRLNLAFARILVAAGEREAGLERMLGLDPDGFVGTPFAESAAELYLSLGLPLRAERCLGPTDCREASSPRVGYLRAMARIARGDRVGAATLLGAVDAGGDYGERIGRLRRWLGAMETFRLGNLRFVPLNESHAADYWRFVSEEPERWRDFNRYSAHLRSVGDVAASIRADYRRSEAIPSAALWAVSSGGETIGIVKLSDIRWSEGCCEAGFFVTAKAAGAGAGLLAFSLRVALGALALNKVFALIYDDNPSALAQAERVGLRREARVNGVVEGRAGSTAGVVHFSAAEEDIARSPVLRRFTAKVERVGNE